ncbi:MAG: tetratricopeptide repeat protein, partial [Saprospiraceae bacterium]|nr:tetratricopeptide repeat protein [Saprospiraceae bacterium]
TDIAMICRQLDGLPLAIELAAARIKLFSPSSLMQRLDRHLDILKSQNIDRPSRHQTLRELIAWSYDLLPPREQKLLHQLAVFSGGATLEAIETVCFAEEERFDALDLVLALVNKSLLQKHEGTMGEPRFTLLQTIRSFAMEALQQSDVYSETRSAHVAYYLERAERIQPRLTGAKANEWYDVLESDLDNYREAINWATEHAKIASAFRLSAALGRLWIHRGMLVEGVQLYTRLLQIPTSDAERSERIKVLEALGVTHFYTNRYAPAVDIFRETLAYWQEQDAKPETASALNHLGFACGNSGLTDEGIAYSLQALEMYDRLDVDRGRSISHNNLGWIYMALGDPGKALSCFEQSLQYRERAGDTPGTGFQLMSIAWALGPLGRYQEARAVFDRAFDLLHAEDKVVRWWGMLLRTSHLLQMNELDQCEQSMEAWHEHEVKEATHPTAYTYYLRASVALCHHDYTQAKHQLEQGQAMFAQTRSDVFSAEGWILHSRIALASGDTETAIHSVRQGLEIHHSSQCKLGLAEGFEQAALICFHVHDYRLMSVLLTRARALREALGTPVPPVYRAALDQAWEKAEKEVPAHELEALVGEAKKVDDEDLLQQFLQTAKSWF